MSIKTAKELAAAAKNVAQNFKTLYVMGCFGAPMTDSNKDRYTRNHEYNRDTVRTTMIKSATANTFGFDCVGLIKALLWGWDGDRSQTYGGVKYGSNGVPDTNADGMIKMCSDVSTDFSKIQVGEVVHMSGHIGIYIGGGLAVECTPSWGNCVQITAVGNIGKKAGYNTRTWVKHGKLPWVSYDAADETPVLYRVIVENMSADTAAQIESQLKAMGCAYTLEAMEAADAPDAPATPAEPEKPDGTYIPEVGDVVNFTGDTNYTNAQAKTGKKCAAGVAKITAIVQGTKHPYHLKRTGKTGPYGWVDAGTFTKA